VGRDQTAAPQVGIFADPATLAYLGGSNATGTCDPPVAPECAREESDPLTPDTNGLGAMYCGPFTTICEPQSAENQTGRPPVQVHTSPSGRLRIATWPGATVQDQTIENLGSEDCNNVADDDADGAADCDDPDCDNTTSCGGESVTFDMDDADVNVPTAGFAFTRKPVTVSVEQERDAILEELRQRFSPSNVAVRSVGATAIVLNGVDSVVEIKLAIDVPDAIHLSTFRDQLVATVLRRSTNELINLPGTFGLAATAFIASFSIQCRTPPVGGPILAVMGATMNRAYYDAADGSRALLVADAANGSGLADASYSLTAECEVRAEVLPTLVVDMIWVVDDSFSAQPVRARLAAATPALWSEAISLGLDFRMGIVDMQIDNNGIFCTAQGQSNDFFLTPANLSQFEDCVLDPTGSLNVGSGQPHGITQGYNAILNHLPRANLPNRIRSDAQLAAIYISDEAAREVQLSCGASPPWDPACIQTEIQPTLNLLQGISNPEGMGTAHAVVGPPPSGCSEAVLGGGYIDIANDTGGQVFSICASDFAATLRVILQNIQPTSS